MNIIWAFVLLIGLTGQAAADDACHKDRVTTCNDVTPGDSRQFDCLLGRAERVRPECATAARRANELTEAVVKFCKDDAYRWCAQYSDSGRPAVIDCLKSHREKVTDPCKRAYRQFKAHGFDIKS
jgi:hypothetical protein